MALGAPLALKLRFEAEGLGSADLC